MTEKIQPMTLKQLAELYNIDKRTMFRWIETAQSDLGFLRPNGRLYTPAQIRKIFDAIGTPELYNS